MNPFKGAAMALDAAEARDIQTLRAIVAEFILLVLEDLGDK